MKQKIIIYVLVSLCWFASNYAVFHYSRDHGMLEGIKAYHGQCFEVGGYIIDEQGKVVACQGQGNIPKEELKNFKSTL